MTSTATKEGRDKRLDELVRGYEENHNRPALVRLVGGSVDSFGDYDPQDAGEEPKQ